ncbi:carbohydrate ABC transporter permease [Priestia flexa]|uniref:ABC transporter permease n=2 Tax=Priestia TaxID=2800373 RepID=A0A0V8JJZ0_9BACI|nr:MULTISPECIES: carbohydrate ABC transporter permease [Bacillaceae]AQX56521.1 ABC transporter permease [Priestia flexa]KSU87363.1 ABC transporter permease [Priestia veravalensis]KZB91965.1 ABC transporter permease [Bacillus sp. VT 712]MBN8250981.1 carbohydrate ABC transporter permease [Priestia flexa]MBN8433199.1 carbohydrate ABC transporter permease [Priestia flexa]
MRKIGLYFLLGIFTVISIFPFYWMFIGATNESGKMFTNPPTLTPGDQFMTNFQNLNASIDLGRVFFNSMFVSIVYVIVALMVCSTAAYALSKFEFKGRNLIFTTFLLSMMIPYQATLIPLFQMMSNFNLLDTYFALIAPQLCYPFAIFLLRQNFLAFPTELIEAARLDGAGEFRIFLTIVLPSMKPAMAAAAIFLFMTQWNNFMWPLVATTSNEMATLPVALSSLIGLSFIDYGQVMMGVTIATIPIIIFFLALQRHFISGMLGSAVK